MAIIKCTIQEYHHFIGARIRNAIQSLTSKARKERNGICEHCGNKGELDSAHIHGKGRRDIIENILLNYMVDDLVYGDLDEIEGRILSKHHPVESAFKFLCKPCHVAYDNGNAKCSISGKRKTRNNSSAKTNTDPDFQKIGRIKLWAKRDGQDNHKMIMAYLELAKKGNVTLDTLKSKCSSKIFRQDLLIEKFDGHFASMKTDNGNSHGKVFYEELGYVKIYPQVMEEIYKYFPSAGR